MPGLSQRPADRFVFSGEEVSGSLDTSFAVEPTGTITIDGREATQVQVSEDPLGWRLTGSLEFVPDHSATSVTVFLPRVNVGDGSEPFDAFLVVATAYTSFAGPALVPGPLAAYQTRALTGTATRTDSATA